MIKNTIAELIGNTDLLKIPSLSKLTGSDIFLKCEFQNPGGSVKDRAALHMVQAAIERGELKKGMTIVEGTAGNTGIGLAVVAKAYGLKMLTVMPKGQTPEKERMVALHGAELHLVDPCPFANENHFYHTARRIAESRDDYWWANQFENTDNAMAHYSHTAPEIWQQMDHNIDAFVSVCGTGGTVAGNSKYFKEQDANVDVWLIDAGGSGIAHYLKHGEYKASGESFTEGIGIMRTVENFRLAQIDYATQLPDADLVTVSRYVRDHDGIVLGSSSALNVAGALLVAAQAKRQGKSGQRIVTFACDGGERSFSKLYNEEFLAGKGINPEQESIEALFARYQTFGEQHIVRVKRHERD